MRWRCYSGVVRMLPPYRPSPPVGKRVPVVLPRGCEAADWADGDGWPRFLNIPNGAGLRDWMCLYWHGDSAANDSPAAR